MEEESFQDIPVVSYKAVLMGSPIILKLFEHNEDLASRVFRLIKHYEDLFTVNRTESEVMSINHSAGFNPVTVSKPVYELIKCAKSASMISNSTFNLAIGPLVKRWKIGFKGDTVPPQEEITKLLQITHPEDVVLDDSTNSVYLNRMGMEIDLGAIAKGYIADRVRDYLINENVNAGIINLGGNVQTLGSPQGGWSIGLKRPFGNPDDVIGTMEVENKSVVTSGIYERYFEQDGKIYHHILDPKTGYPLDNELYSITIISANSIDGDIWTTLIYGMGVERGCRVLSKKSDIEAVFVTKNQEIIISSSKLFRFTLLDQSYKLIKKNA